MLTKKFAVHTTLFATKVWASDKHHNTRNCQETLLVSNLTWQDLFFAYVFEIQLLFKYHRKLYRSKKKWQHLSCTVQWPSRFVYCGAVSQVKVSADTMCLQKATDKSWALFRTFQKKEKNRDYIELAYSQLKQLVGSGISLQIYVGNFWLRCAQPRRRSSTSRTRP